MTVVWWCEVALAATYGHRPVSCLDGHDACGGMQLAPLDALVIERTTREPATKGGWPETVQFGARQWCISNNGDPNIVGPSRLFDYLFVISHINAVEKAIARDGR